MTTQLYDLSQLFAPGAAMWPRFAKDVQYGSASFVGVHSSGWGGENHPGWYEFGQGFPYNRGYCPMGQFVWWGHLHAGTHIDAPVYAIPGGAGADKIPLDRLYGTGVVVDMRHKRRWDVITAADFENAAPKIEEDDFVVVNTGWHEWLKPDRAYEYFNYYPGLVPSAAEWLIERKVKAIAGTWPVVDHSLSFAPLKDNMPWVYQDYVRATGGEPSETLALGGFEECLEMLLGSGITCVQNVGGDVDQATGKRLTLCALPFRLEEADAAMVRLVAIEEDE